MITSEIVRGSLHNDDDDDDDDTGEIAYDYQWDSLWLPVR